jgi:hypothetical protein
MTAWVGTDRGRNDCGGPVPLETTMALENELALYRSKLGELLAHEGKYVVIKGEEILGTYATFGLALKAGYDRYGPVSFLCKPIHRLEPILFFSHDLPRISA